MLRRMWLLQATLLMVLTTSGSCFLSGSLKAQDTTGDFSIATEMLAQDALAAVAVFPQQVLSSPQMKLMPIEIASAWSVENIGVDVQDVESITACVGSPSPAGVEFGFVIKLSKDFDARLLNKRLIAGPAEVIGGYRAIPLANLPNAYLHRIDPKTYVAATPEFLTQMMAGTGSAGPLGELISSQTPSSSPILAAMVVEPVREQLMQATAQAPPDLPGPLRELLQLPRLLKGVYIEAGLLPGDTVRLTMIGRGDGETQEMEGSLNDAMMFGRDLAVMQAMQQVEGNGAIPEATRNYISRLAEEITTMLKPKRSGDQLVIEIENQGGMATTGVLVGLLLPAVQSAREAARRMSSTNNLKQIMLAFHNYADTYREFPKPISRDDDGKPLLSWRVAILPFIEQMELYNEFHLDEPWDSEHNIKLLERMPAIYADPGIQLAPGMTVYQVPVGEGLLFTSEGRTQFRDILDGTSNTIALFESAAEQAVPWSKPEDVEISQDDPLANMGDYRQGGFNVGFADGSVRFISENVDPELFWKLLTRAGGEPVQF